MHRFLRQRSDRQTDRQTNKQTNGSENPTPATEIGVAKYG